MPISIGQKGMAAVEFPVQQGWHPEYDSSFKLVYG